MRLYEGSMTSWLPTLAGEPALAQLLVAALAVCVAALVVWFALAILRVRSHRTRAVLWLTVLFVPMVTLTMLNVPPLFAFEIPTEAQALPFVQAELPVLSEGEEIFPEALPDTGEVFYIDASAFGASETTMAVEQPKHSAIPTIPIPVAVTIAWAVIVCFFVGRLMLDSLKRVRIQQSASAPNEDMTQRWEAQLTRLGLSPSKAPRLMVTTNLESPALLGCVRPTILIPTWLAEREDPNALEWAMRHELTHWKHNDHWANALRRLAEALFFFHPVVWWASRKWDTSAELACDRSVITSEAEAKQYTGELYTMFTMIQSRRKMRLACGLFATRIQIAERIKALTTNPLRTPGSLTLTGWLASLLILATAFTASAISVEFTQPETEPPVASKLPEPATVNVPEVIEEDDAAPSPTPVTEMQEITIAKHAELTPPTAEVAPTAITEEPPIAPETTPEQNVQPTVKPELAIEKDITPKQIETIEAPPTRLAKQTPPIAEFEQREDTLPKAPKAQYSVETKIILIPKDVKDSFKPSGYTGITILTLIETPNQKTPEAKQQNVNTIAHRIYLPPPASMEAFNQIIQEAAQEYSSSFAHLKSNSIAYKVKRDESTDGYLEYIGEKMNAELLSAPRVTIAPNTPDALYKLLVDSPSKNDSDRFGGGGFGLGGGGEGHGSTDSPPDPPAPDPLERFRDSPEIMNLMEKFRDNRGSFALMVDIRYPVDKMTFDGLALGLAVSPDPTSDAVQLHVATHYRMDDYTMERKGAFRRLKRVHAGTVDIQMNHQETLAPDEALVLVRLMPHSGDTLLTVITVDKVTVAPTKFIEAIPVGEIKGDSTFLDRRGSNISGRAIASRGKSIEEQLDRQVTIVFEDIHLDEIVEFLNETYKINIIVDQRQVQPKDPADVDPEATYVTDGVIGFIRLKSVELRQALRAILRPLNLDYSVRPGYIWITSRENLKHETSADLSTRYYELSSTEIQNINADLNGKDLELIDIENLLRHVVPDLVKPTTENPISFMNLNEETKLLVVHTTATNHRKIEQMLKLID